MTQLSLEKVSDLLGQTGLLGTKANLQNLVEYTQNLLDHKGEEYVRQNKELLLKEWDPIHSM